MFQVWFKNRRAKCRQQQKSQDGKKPQVKKSKSPPPTSTTSPGSYKTSPVVSSPNSSLNSTTSLWSPASSDHMTMNSCMGNQRHAQSHHMQTPVYNPQHYPPTSYYNNMDFMSMQLPVVGSNQLSNMSAIANSQNGQVGSYGPLHGSQAIPRQTHGDCLEYKDNAWSRFQVLWRNFW